ncbi:DNA-binding MarR family transcriptional regulator [Bacillus ectoiniformans]|uniref:Lrp/AsnC family transcriptional regulator n=1 Tax=Bacillus ectoiniformans TaxID=1494429 RepID=UPI00195CF1AC|nr:Lrp/AsnC family transcriptional regulator [Bacillus ectoiniformans]MBM7649495.1 DNA-binding MarR family transcriptional regulator [Bacillus ectoiniformans]
MKLTNRRKQFLEEIVHMYSKTNEPVHYSDIAEMIGVSKWTAYDVLKELEKHDFLKRTYAVNPNETGRSIVVYIPTDQSKNLFAQQGKSAPAEEEWSQIKNEVLAFVSRTSKDEQPIEPLLSMMTNVHYKVELCAYFIGVLLVYLNRQGKTIKELTVNLIHVSDVPIIQLSTVVGAVIGMIIDSASEEISPDMVDLVKQFMKALQELNEVECQYLIGFLKEA